MGIIRTIHANSRIEETKREWRRVNRKYVDGEVLTDAEQAILIEAYACMTEVVIDPERLKCEMAIVAEMLELGLPTQMGCPLVTLSTDN